MHYVDGPIGVREEPGVLVRPAGKQFYDPDDGSLVGAWLFDEGLGLFARDHSIYGNHGDLVGPDWVAEGLDFVPGNSDYVDCGNDASLKNLEQITILIWVRPDDVTVDWGRFAQKWGDAGQRSWALIQDSTNGYVNFLIYPDGSTGLELITSSVVIVNDTWSMLAATYDAHHQKIYAAGELNAASVDRDAVLFKSTATVQISHSTAPHFDGTIHSVFIYNRALSAYEIRNIYLAGKYRRTETYRILNG